MHLPRSFHHIVALLVAFSTLVVSSFAQSGSAERAATGTVSGRVFDDGFGMPLVGVRVSIVGSNLTGATDLGGNYTISGVPAGTVEVAFESGTHAGGTVSDVVVEAGQVTRLDTTLQSLDGEVIVAEEFHVTASAVTGSPTRQIAERKNAVVPIERFDSSEFSKFAASDAADLLRLMTGVSIASGPSGKFAVVRGLAERYNPVMLDGIVLPSPDPERQTPQLDLFPSKLMDSLAIYKAASAELPAFSSGGAIDIRTRPFPEQRNGQIQIGMKFDGGMFDSSTFRDYRTRGDKDLIARGKDDRARGVLATDLPNGGQYFYQQAGTTFGFRNHDVPPGYRFAINFEDRLPIGTSDREFAYGFNIAYDSGYSTGEREDYELREYVRPGDVLATDPTLYDINTYSDSTEEVAIGLLGVVGMKFGPEHTVSLSAFLAQNGEDTVTVGLGLAESGTFPYHSLHYKQRNLTSLRLAGEHVIGAAIDGRLRWRVARLSTSQDEPDYRFVPYDLREDGGYGMIAGGPERRLTRYWREVGEKTWSGGADYAFRVPQAWLPDLGFKVGVSLEETDRTFDEKFHYWSGRQFEFDDFERELARRMNELAFNGVGLPLDGMSNSFSDVTARREVSAPYASLSARLFGENESRYSLTLNAGLQLERYRMDVDGLNVWGGYSVSAFYNANPFLVADTRWEPDGPFGFFRRYFSEQKVDSTLPSAGLVFTAGKNLFFRLNAAKTTARPSFREAGPYYTVDQVTLSNVAGNIALRPSSVRNFDFRAEYFFPKSLDLVAVSLFAKDIDGAIERVGLEGEFSPLTDTWINNPASAKVRGVEAEFRKSLGFIASWLEPFTFGGNGAWIDAEVERFPYELKDPALFRSTRRLYDQPEWIANGYLTFAQRRSGFSATVSVSAVSDVLRAANQVTVDEFLEGHTRLDLTVSQRIGRAWLVRLSGSNLTDPERRVIFDRAYVNRGDAQGFAFSRWQEGRSYSVSLQRSF